MNYHPRIRNTTISIIVIASFFIPLVPSPINAGIMQWTMVDTPSNFNNVIVSPSEINFISASPDGMTIFATDIPNNKVYKSTDGGYFWSDISNNLTDAGAILPGWNIQVAPDNPDIVVLVTSSLGQPSDVFISTNGGALWQDLDCPAISNISAIDISGFYGNYDIVVGTRTGSGGGRLLVFKMSGTVSWADQGFDSDVLALKFSPNYSSDNSIAVVSSNNAGTFINLGIRDIIANQSDFGVWGPVEITIAGAGTSPKADQIKTADIDLPQDFSGQVNASRKFFVSTNDSGATGNAGVFRIDDNLVYQLMPASGNKMISSISYTGNSISGKLLAGEVKANPSLATVDVWYCPNATATCPMSSCIIWQKSQKPPTGGAGSGNANAQVIWCQNGNKACCGTSSADIVSAGFPNGYLITRALDESAFSYSMDNALSWNQTGLIDTQINYLSDVAPLFDSSIIFLSSINTGSGFDGFDSIWKTTSSSQLKAWERIMCILADNEIITRTNPSRPDVIFVGIRNSGNLIQSVDSGQIWNSTTPGVNITDFQVIEIENVPTVFILSGGNVKKGEFTGISWRWSPPIGTGLFSGHTITVNPIGVVIVGDEQGGISYSFNSGGQFTSLPSLPVNGNVHAILDTRVKDPYLIHAATDNPNSSIYSWVLDRSDRWLDMQPPGQGYYGLAQLDTFYGSWSSSGNSAVVRTLKPELLGAPFIEWSTMEANLNPGVEFTREPSALKISSGVNLWAIDNRPYSSTSGRLWRYSDSLSGDAGTGSLPPQEVLLQAPVLSSPTPNTLIELDETGNIPTIEFQWRHPTAANGYDIWIATDRDFQQIVLQRSVRPDNVMVPRVKLEAQDTPLEPDQTYYWRVRVNRIAYTYQSIDGQWSDVQSFSISPKISPDTPTVEPTSTTPPDQSTIPESPPPSTTPVQTTINPLWIYSLSGILVLLIIILCVVLIRRKSRTIN